MGRKRKIVEAATELLKCVTDDDLEAVRVEIDLAQKRLNVLKLVESSLVVALARRDGHPVDEIAETEPMMPKMGQRSVADEVDADEAAAGADADVEAREPAKPVRLRGRQGPYLRDRIGKALVSRNAPVSLPDLAADVGSTSQMVALAIADHPWFTVGGGGVSLSPDARQIFQRG